MKFNRRNTVLVLLLASAAALFYSLGVRNRAPKGIRIASVLILEGDFRTYGENVRVGISLAAEELERETGEHIEVGFKSFNGDKSRAREAVEASVLKDGYQFIVEVFGTAAGEEVAPIVNQLHIPTVSGVNTGYALSGKMSPYMFRIIPHDGEAAEALLDWVKSRGITSATVISVTTDWGKGLADVLQNAAPKYQIKLDRVNVSEGQMAFDSSIDELRKSRVEAVFLALNPAQAGTFVRSFRKANGTALLFGTDNLTAGEFTTTAGVDAAGVRYVLPPSGVPSQRREAIAASLRARLKLPPGENPHPFAFYGYDSLRTMVAAIRASDRTPEGVVAALEKTDLEGATGRIRFSREHNLMPPGPHSRLRIAVDASGKTEAVPEQ